MYSKVRLFVIGIIFNLIIFNYATTVLITGKLRCNNQSYPNGEVKLFDSSSSLTPTLTTKSIDDGSFTLSKDISNPRSKYHLSIYYNCSSHGISSPCRLVYSKDISLQDRGGIKRSSQGIINLEAQTVGVKPDCTYG
uniref:ZP domain-containing protein n=1 Tax=Parastrongyloides trichosuri TaxID=131310 RepID=A0A0N5A6N8_PARTI